MSNKKRILFGAIDIGWRIKTYTSFLHNNEQNINKIKSFVKYKVSKSQYDTNYDIEANYLDYSKPRQWIYSIIIFIISLFRFNTFYFFSGETLLTRKLRRLEFRVYTLLNKKIIMHFVGSDIRDPNYLYWKAEQIESEYKPKDSHPISAQWQMELIQDTEEFAQHIIVSTPDLISLVKNAIYYPVVIDINEFSKELNTHKASESFFKTNKIKILHAPSNVKLKGSATIYRALSEIEKETNLIEFIYTPDLKRETGTVYTVSRYELFQLYNEADIVIDQLVIGWYGLQAIEALLANCHVFCYIDKHLEKYLEKGCPIINTNAISIKEDIIKFIKTYKEPNLKANQKWVEKHHTIEQNNEPLMNAIFR